MIYIGDPTEQQTNNRQKDNQQDTRIDSLQSAVDELNAQVYEISVALDAISESIDDKYDAQTQTLMAALTSKIDELTEYLATVVSTAQVNADVGNFKYLAATISTTLSGLSADVATITQKAIVKDAEIETLEADSIDADELSATIANLETANINLLNVTSFVVTALTVEKLTAEEIEAESAAIKDIEADKINTRNITGKEWHTPISTPNNAQLLHIIIPKYSGVVQVQTMDDELSLTIFNNGSVAYNEKDDFLYRVNRDENNVNVYLANIGDTINYRILYIGSESYTESYSEIVDKTLYEKNIESLSGVLFLNDSGEVSVVGDYQKKITGAASTITENDLAKNLVMVTDNDGKAGVENVTRTELLALRGITSNVQEQLDEKQDKTLSTDVTLGGHVYETVESALAAVVSVLNALITDDIIYNEAEEELIFPYNSIIYDNDELTVTGFNVTVVGEEITFTR